MMSEESSAKSRSLVLAAIFGIAFGFLLQKGGVAKFNVLIGVLLLEDFTVVKVMLSAILVGMVGVFTLHGLGKVQLHIEPTRLAAQISGGIIFGVGFALLAYCPGTGAAALGQGNWDALFGFAGLMAGSYLFAEFSSVLGKTVEKWGDKGKRTLPGILHIPNAVAVAGAVIIIAGVLLALEHYTVR